MIGIIGAMDAEVELLKAALQNPVTRTEAKFEFIAGKLEGRDVVLLKCGICKVNAAIGAALMIRFYKPELVINTGSAGGLDRTLTFGDVVIAGEAAYCDVDVTAFNYVKGQVPGSPPRFAADEKALRAAERAVDELKAEGILPAGMNHVRGLVCSSDEFVHTEAVTSRIMRDFPDVKAVEMEGAGIAQACSVFSVGSLIIRAVSDVAGKDSPMTHDEFLPLASKNSAEIVRRIVRTL